ncbi:uncharacterized protein Z519_00751 [Cladophialophora bantiana CBS 173.52]|uniref:DDHD domain-containing protein n=1 Tax=Cladophialophora bantiana (strain ATCC 10958 / CBS 173.52 / CDC B-1940 / NIH 8579) TaxID=1442370 RepID=A0A0D2I051_CLAB1|nr:uncharacterized protein Z519_00751 [Cladophialophora bantiana CBS 173.52]KIW99088.1 hypothetical protein Z519_00751 [Cladophialophora bantiana CBS 173.52]
MAEGANKSSLASSIFSWSRSSTPPPKSPLPKTNDASPALRQSSGLDHTVSLGPSPSLRRYPKDCPPLKPRWHYAVDVAKRKPFAPDPAPEEKAKPPPVPKKLVAFSASDSQSIEKAYQTLAQRNPSRDGGTEPPTNTTVAVNEDFLYDVDIEKRELLPAYWLGPVYEVRRGTWFYAENPLKPCDENLANQLEEGYIKVAPWRRLNLQSPRSASQPRTRPNSAIIDGSSTQSLSKSPASQDDGQPPGPNTYRLFGTHMNTTVTYQDDTVAYLTTDDFLSRVSSTVYGRFIGYGGTKVVRGWSDTKLADPPKVDQKEESKSTEATSTKEKRRSTKIPPEVTSSAGEENIQAKKKDNVEKPRRTALERQISSLAGLPKADDSDDLGEEEEAREQEEREMEDARERDGEDQARQIDHLVLVTHGIGQRLGLRLDSINFVHDVNTLRKTMKAVYKSAPDLQTLSGDPKNCKVQVLPICWRHKLDFPKQSLKQNRKEYDIGDVDALFDDDYPSLQDITVDGVPAVRNLITDLALDVLLYQSAYREHIASIVQKEANRVYRLFKERTGFSGKVSFCGHSLGSAICFDLLCRQEEDLKTRPRRVSSKTSREHGIEQNDLRLDFEVENFFALGSPVGLFQMLKGRMIAARPSPGASAFGATVAPISPFDPDPMRNDPFESVASKLTTGNSPTGLIPITTSSPKCNELFNIFHPTDPIAYRMEPLISPAMAQLKSQPIPYTKKNLFAAPGISNISGLVSQQIISSWYNLTSGMASSLINRSLGITGEEQALSRDKAKAVTAAKEASQTNPQLDIPVADEQKQQELAEAAKSSPSTEQAPTLIDSEMETLYAGFQKRQAATDALDDEAQARTSTEFRQSQERARKLKREEAKVRALNSNGRVDYHIQEGLFDVSLLASIASHLSYWADEDVNHFIIGQMLKTKGRVSERGRGMEDSW